MKFIPMNGYIRLGYVSLSIRVDGWAFQIPGYEYLHTWVTPSNYFRNAYVVSHWESGCCVSQAGTYSNTREGAADLAVNLIRGKGHKRVRAALDALK